MKISSLLSVSSALAVANAQQSAYGQCGGTSWTGATTCVSGYYCLTQNEYYAQCIPASTTVSLSSSTKASSSTLSTVTTSKVSSVSTTNSAATSSSSAITSFAKTNGDVFTINGKTEYWMGTNSYWIGFLTNNADVDLVMSHLASTGLKVLRVWGFNDVTSTPSSGTVWFQSFVTGSSPVINTGTDGLQRLDYVVQSAEAHGISLIINFVNNWTDYGGMAAYCTYYGISPVTDWYTNAAAQAQYQTYIAAVVARYKTSTAVFAWELANEPRCSGCDTSVITTWIKTTSAYIKSLDSNHMVTIGDEGFGLTTGSDGSYPYTTGPGLNFTTNLAISTIDFGTYHLYPSSWGEVDSWGNGWITAHATAAAAIGKPVIMEEYGSLTHSDEASWQATVLSTQTAGDMYWQYGDDLSTGETSDDGYAIYYGSTEYATLVTAHAAAMLAKAV
ncbi:glycoside hydrolase family 5 protein [Mollisia scopiformis]|uniref:mannan endo-1,4-beta-mannosidase n=1 Tax=Mollisia scopiformis TaxID=149040 RepID=A0A194XIC8_MOLSC|nr:glycoside hydrolase family 5 protein [Mollisia scopiformis]KUJ19886.1 glycoside hydrolase family 5 protein [Mollisia scopiformis]